MLEGLTPPVRELLCAFIINAADQLSDKDMEILRENLDDPRWSHKGLSVALSERGFKCYDDQVRQHRTGKCRCA
jgi:hypothetical protein